jgi:hypothetical protein
VPTVAVPTTRQARWTPAERVLSLSRWIDIEGDKKVRLNRVKLFTATCINGSHASSAMDIVLGTFRYCINQPKNIAAAKKMMANVTRLIWHEQDGENIHAMERGLIFRPKLPNISVPAYKAEYMAW